MKYAKILIDQLKLYDSQIKKQCLQYKKWKKEIKYNKEYIIRKWKSILIKECNSVDKMFYKSCFNNFNLPKITLNHLSFININTLYKICKKLHKKLKVDSMEFLNEIIKSRKYKFTKIAYETLI